jgi:hypothetical protein
LRWDTLPPGGFCGGVLPDPRIKGSGGKFCEDLFGPLDSAVSLQNALFEHPALLFSRSQFNTRALTTFKNGSLYLVSGAPWNEDTHVFPAPGYAVDMTEYPSIAQVLTRSMHGAQVELVLYRNRVTGVFRTTATPPGGLWDRVDSAGWIFKKSSLVPAGLQAVLLVGWSDSANSRYLLLRSGQTPPPAYGNPHNEGWALAPIN